MVKIVLQSVLIGILVSAPMGPSGILCVQRTLSKGRMHGLFTGIGVAVSDLCYALLTGLSMGFITSFIKDNEIVLQLVGSVVIFGFGLYLYLHNPIRNLSQSQNQNLASYWQSFLSGFFLTFTNVFIIFFFVGLFARFSIFNPDFTLYQHLFPFPFIFIGCFIWWYVLTFLLSKVKTYFNIRNVWIINKITGIIIMIVSIVGLLWALKVFPS